MIIVTGGAGFIGSNIIKLLNHKGITNILVVDNLKNSVKFKNLADLNIIDFMDKEDYLIKIIERKKFGNIEAIFHEGACSCTTELNGKYIMRNNYQYSKELLHYCLKYEIPLLYASSASVYGDRFSDFIESRRYEKPLNIYGYSKFLFDEHVRKNLKRSKSQVVGLRYFNVYGPYEDYKGSMASIMFHLHSQLKKGESLKLFQGSENFKRDFIHVDDIVTINLWFLENGISGIFNIGTGRSESFKSVADEIISYHKKGSIEYIPFPERLKGCYQRFTQADLTNLRISGYNGSFKTLKEGIKEYMVWLNCKTFNDS